MMKKIHCFTFRCFGWPEKQRTPMSQFDFKNAQRLVDCTHTLKPEAFTFISNPVTTSGGFNVMDGVQYAPGTEVPFATGRFDATTMCDGRGRPDGFRKCMYRMACDVGTHIDAPCHWAVDGRDISQLTLEELTAPGAVIDVSAKCAANPVYELTVADIEEWEAAHGRLPDRALVVMKTGWGAKFDDHVAYLGFDAEAKTCNFPGFSGEAAQFLLDQRSIVGIGIDTGSLDCGISATFPVHNIILHGDKYQIENMMLEDVPGGAGVTFISLPLKVEGGPEAETRVMAVIH